MRIPVASLLAAILCALCMPAVASAEFVPLVNNRGCTAASAGDPTSEKSFTIATAATEVKSYLDTKVMCPSPCFDMAVTLKVDKTNIGVSIKGVNKCSIRSDDPKAENAAKDNRGCAANQIKPSVVVSVTGVVEKTYPAKSRCDVSSFGAVVDSVSKGDYDGALATLERLAGPAEAGPNLLGAASGNESLVSAFKAQGLTEAQAKEIVAKNPQEAERYIDAIAANDKAAIAASAQKLGLNPNITDAQQKAVLKAIEESLPENQRAEWRGTIQSSPDTFAGGGQPDQIAAAAQEICAQVSCGEACSKRPDRLVCQTNNPGAIICSKVATKYGATGCHSNNQTAIFPSVEHGAAAMAELLTTSSRYFGSGEKGILQAICSGYSEKNCQQYATFVAKQVGISPMQKIDPRDSTTIAKIMTAMSRFENGGGAIFTPTQLQKAFDYVYKGEIPAGTPGYQGGYAYGGTQTQYESPFSVGGGQHTSGAGIDSPFANMNPFSQSSGGGYSSGGGLPNASGYGGSGYGTGRGASSVNSGGRPVQNEPVVPVVPRTLPANAVVNLYVQPKEVAKGSSVSIAWSSAGVEQKPECVVKMATSSPQTLAESNDGSRTVKLEYADTYTFTIQCTAQDGTVIEKKESVSVK